MPVTGGRYDRRSCIESYTVLFKVLLSTAAVLGMSRRIQVSCDNAAVLRDAIKWKTAVKSLPFFEKLRDVTMEQTCALQTAS